MRNQHQIQQQNKTLIRASVIAIQFPNNPQSSNWSFSNNFRKSNNRPPLYCSNCGGNWLPRHRDKCIAKGKTCNNCGLMNHFAKVCRKQKKAKPQNSKKRTRNIVDEEPHPEDSVNFLCSTKLYESDYSSGEDNTLALIENEQYSKSITRVASSPHSIWINENVSLELRTSRMNQVTLKEKYRPHYKQRLDIKFGHFHFRCGRSQISNR